MFETGTNIGISLSRACHNGLFYITTFPALYFGILISLLILLGWMVASDWQKQEASAWLQNDKLFMVLALLAMIWARWPSFIPIEFNPDESQALAAAAKYARDPMPFISVDGATHGPLLYYLLVVPYLTTPFILDYGLARLCGVLLCFVTIVASYYLLLKVASKPIGRLIALLLVFFECTVSSLEWLFYSSEMLPTALLSILLAILIPTQKMTTRKMILIGCGASLLPYMKLQFVPIGGAVLAVAILRVIRMKSESRNKKLRLAFTLVASLFLIPTGITLLLVFNGGWNDFWQCYILDNALHAKQVRVHEAFLSEFQTNDTQTMPQRLIKSVSLLAIRPQGRWLAAIPTLWLLFSGIYLASRKLLDPDKKQILFDLAVVLSACWIAILLPGTGYDHYLRIVVPLSFTLCGFLLSLTHRSNAKLLPLFVLLSVCPFLGDKLFYVTAKTGTFNITEAPAFFSQFPLEKYQSNVAKTVAVHSDPGDFVAVWGWSPLVYIQTNTVPATPELTCERLLEPRFDQEFYRERYLRHLNKNKPPVVVDAVGSYMYKDRSKYGPETFPELWDILESEYQLVEASESFRVWVRKGE